MVTVPFGERCETCETIRTTVAHELKFNFVDKF